jgi:hypothetical protein
VSSQSRELTSRQRLGRNGHEAIFQLNEGSRKRSALMLQPCLASRPTLEVEMTALVRAISHAGIQINVEPLKTIAMFCGVGLFVTLLFVSYGIDLSPGFF